MGIDFPVCMLFPLVLHNNKIFTSSDKHQIRLNAFPVSDNRCGSCGQESSDGLTVIVEKDGESHWWTCIQMSLQQHVFKD